MGKFSNPLRNVRIASPCSANWDEMIGSSRKRFCSQCSLNVYNLSEMTKTEAERLIINTEGRLCARFYRRADGSVITKNCPVGWAAAKKRLSRLWTAVASLFIAMTAGIGLNSFFSSSPQPGVTCEWPAYTPERPRYPENEMGKIAIDDSHSIMGEIAYPVTTTGEDPELEVFDISDCQTDCGGD